jgi:hypothetical protein
MVLFLLIKSSKDRDIFKWKPKDAKTSFLKSLTNYLIIIIDNAEGYT